MRAVAIAAGALLALALSSAGCGPDDVEDGVCSAGESRSCSCETGAEGTQSCHADGQGYGRCLCSAPGDAGVDAGPGADAASSDAAGPDALEADAALPDSSMPDTSPVFDAAVPALPTLRQLSLPASSRGPIAVRVEVATPWPLALQLEVDSGSGFAPASLFQAASDLPTPAPVDDVIVATLVWDSVADMADDGSVWLRLSYSADAGSDVLDAPVAVQVHNAPDGTRVLLAAHPSGMLDGGGSSNVNNKVSVLSIAGDGTGVDHGEDISVGQGPDMVAFAATAALAVVRNGGEGSLSLLDVDGSAVVPRATPYDLSPDWIYSFALAPDARHLFVLAGSSGVSSLLELELIDGVAVERRSVDFDSVAQCLAVAPRGEQIAVSRADPNADRILELFDRRSLALLGSLPYTSTLCDTLRYSADGDFVVTTDNMFGNLLTLFDVSDPAVPAVADTLSSLDGPMDAVFHPAGGVMLVSQLTGNSVVPVTFDAVGALSTGTAVSGGLPLAAEMDLLVRGGREGLVAVSALSSVVLVQLNADGSAAKTGTVDTGEGIEAAVQGVAIAP